MTSGMLKLEVSDRVGESPPTVFRTPARGRSGDAIVSLDLCVLA